ncbi:MAG TPA: ABC transporter permease [Hyphomicrobiaceae bacterium]|jgi:ABC-type polysaccharide/polyol phosphate export permease|nr:ABC transporter permease [Hyphomicrobiaceae bacterium]
MEYSKSQLQSFGGDIYLGVKASEIWTILGWNDIRQRYRRSTIGPFWITLSTGILIVGLGFIYSHIFKTTIETYLPYLALGFIVWGFISTVTNETCGAFLDSEHILKQIRIPFSVFVLRVIWRNFIVFLHTIVLFVPISIVFGIVPGWTSLLALPGLLLVVLNQFWLGTILAVFSARFRDVPQMVAAVTQVAIFATPIMWPVSALGDHTFVADINPLHHMIDIVRAPLLGEVPGALSWLVALGLNAVNMLLAVALLQRASKRLVYWL